MGTVDNSPSICIELCQPPGVAALFTMIFPIQIFALLALRAAGSPVDLQSKEPENPIEPLAQWAWGSHPNGLGYKAPNDLLYKTCLATPDSPLCYGAATFFQCTRKSEEARKIKRSCMCAQHITNTDCNSIGAKKKKNFSTKKKKKKKKKK